MDNIDQKIPFAQSINTFTDRKIYDALQAAGQSWPCHVVEVNGPIVTVAFDLITPSTITLPQVTVPLFGPEYIRYPIQVGDLGVCFAASVSLRGVSGLGTGKADFSDPGNLTSLVFFPIGNKNWSEVDSQAVTIYGPNGVVLRDTNSDTVITLTPTGINIVRGDTNISIDESSVNITASSISLNGAIQLNGTISQTNYGGHGTTANFIGPINVINDVTAEGKSLATHTHAVPNVQTGGSTVDTTSPL